MRMVIKVGTSLIAPGGRIDKERMRALVDQLDLNRHEYLIVSSGATGVGPQIHPSTAATPSRTCVSTIVPPASRACKPAPPSARAC